MSHLSQVQMGHYLTHHVVTHGTVITRVTTGCIKTQVTMVIWGAKILLWFDQGYPVVLSGSPGYPVVLSRSSGYPVVLADPRHPYFMNSPQCIYYCRSSPPILYELSPMHLLLQILPTHTLWTLPNAFISTLFHQCHSMYLFPPDWEWVDVM